jgi:hypothetical protein
MMLRCCALVAALLLAWPAAASAALVGEPPAQYVVKAGDTLYELAANYLLRPADASTVRRLNRIANPRRLGIGRVLLIPAELLRSEPITGQLVAYSGQVTVQGPGSGPLRLGMPVAEGYELATGPNAFLTVELPDGSRVSLPSQSRARFVRLRRILLTGAVQREIRLEEGRAHSIVTPMPNPASRFRVVTPTAVSAVRGTDFRVRHDPAAQQSTLEVLEGRVEEASAMAPSAGVETPAGYGAVVAGGVVSPRIKLLPAPVLQAPGQLQDEATVAFTLDPVATAIGYQAQIARDAGFIDLVAEVTATEPRLLFQGVPNGTFFVRLTARDGEGLEGLPSTYAFERRLNTLDLDPPSVVAGARRQYLFKWRSGGGGSESFRFVLSRRPDGGEAVIDTPGLSQPEIVVTDLPPGAYYWRVFVVRREDQRLFEKWSPPQRFEIGG